MKTTEQAIAETTTSTKTNPTLKALYSLFDYQYAVSQVADMLTVLRFSLGQGDGGADAEDITRRTKSVCKLCRKSLLSSMAEMNEVIKQAIADQMEKAEALHTPPAVVTSVPKAGKRKTVTNTTATGEKTGESPMPSR